MKLFGVVIQLNLKWEQQIDSIVAKANTRKYFITTLKRSGVQFDDLVRCYCTFVRPLLEYAGVLAPRIPAIWSRYRGRSSECYHLTPVTAKPDIYQEYQPCLSDTQNCVQTLSVDLPEAPSSTTGYHLAGASVIVITYVTTTICPLCPPNLVVSALVRLCFSLNY